MQLVATQMPQVGIGLEGSQERNSQAQTLPLSLNPHTLEPQALFQEMAGNKSQMALVWTGPDPNPLMMFLVLIVLPLVNQRDLEALRLFLGLQEKVISLIQNGTGLATSPERTWGA